jgi:diguanylate cyclase (GGDEF)-like protein
MNHYLLVIAMIAAQQGLFTVAWIVVGSMRLAPQIVASCMTCTVALTVGMALIGMRDQVPVWAGLWLSNLIIVVAMVALRRGMQRFAFRPTSTLEDGAIILGTAIGLAFTTDAAAAPSRMFFTQLPAAYLLMHSAWIVQRHLGKEFGPRTARMCAVPLWLIGGLQVVRMAGIVIAPEHVVSRMDAPIASNVVFTLSILVSALCINMLVLTMVTLRIVRRLDHLTRQDSMTGLLNRRAIEDALAHEVGRARRRDQRFALLALDVDHFKRINDTHGHPAGDAALVALAQTLREAARTGDLIARVGGEEFWILLPNTDTDGATALAERVRTAVAAQPYLVGDQTIAVTVSVGVAVFEDTVETPQGLFKRADRALYAAKADGRDRCQLAGPARPTTPSGFDESRLAHG